MATLIPGPILPRSVATARRRALLAAVALAISVGVLALLAIAGGWDASVDHLERAQWPLLAAVIAAHLFAYAGYTVAHHHLLNLGPGPSPRWRETTIALVVGFGALPGKGGLVVDRTALLRLGVSREEATSWGLTLVLIELAIVGPAACISAVLLVGAPGVPDTESLPWAILVPLLSLPALIVAAHASDRQRVTKIHPRAWIKERLQALARTLELLRHPREGGPVFLGIAVYSAGEICALAMSLRLCHVHLSVDRLVLAYATGYVLTRRTLPLAGAGVTDALLCVALTSVGLPLHAVVSAVLVYRLTDLTLTLLPALATNAAFIRLAHLQLPASPRPVARS